MREIDDHDVISFDLFDTLIRRKCVKPEKVFPIVEQEYFKQMGKHIDEFISIRVNAEQEARHATGDKEITIREIYQYTGFDDELQSILIEIEQNVEIEQCVLKEEMKCLYQKAVGFKHVIITTDMYLPMETIREILSRCVIEGFEKIYLSNCFGVKKNGQLYELVKKDYPDMRILHIGDSVRADYCSARKHGIDACLIQ